MSQVKNRNITVTEISLLEQCDEKRQQAYFDNIQSAYNFAGETTGEVWDSLFIMGLTIQGLSLLPVHYVDDARSYWIKAPDATATDKTTHWEPSFIVESDCFSEVQ